MTDQPMRKSAASHPGQSFTARDSRCDEQDVVQVEDGFTVFDAIGKDTKGEGLHAGDRIDRHGAAGHHARERRDVGDPPAGFLAFGFDLQLHVLTLASMNPGPHGSA